MNNLQDMRYLGDGVYVGHDGYQIWLMTNSHVSPDDMIALDPEIFKALLQYKESIEKRGQDNG